MTEAQDLTSDLRRSMILKLANDKIRSFSGTIGNDGEYLDPVYRSNASLTETIASDYHDRFLIELIQNAYDAQPANKQSGRIQIVLDLKEGEFGTLFVANTGQAFTEDNVRDLCNIGLSRKPLGESIGNKGLGFRSVVQITDAPEIYSNQPDIPNSDFFSGFCFKFARSEDFTELIKDPRHRQLACRDLPVFHIPMWIKEQSDAVRNFAAKDFSTIIALPLRNEDAQKSVHREIEALQHQQVPMLLFLERVEVLEFFILTKTGNVETQFSYSRSEETTSFDNISLSLVNLGDAGMFFIARRSVLEATMREAIKAAIASKELNEHWVRWRGDGDIAVAIRLDATVKDPRLYTYLPMGEQAEAPFSGHLHGSFFPSSNRMHLNARNRLNAVLLEEATALAADTIHKVVTDSLGSISSRLTNDERAIIVSDLLSWKNVGSLKTEEDLASLVAIQIANLFGEEFQDSPVIPCVNAGVADVTLTWKPPKCARLWPNENSMFSAREAARFANELGVWPIWSELGDRLDRLHEYLVRHAVEFAGEPQGDERARLVSVVAKEIYDTRRESKKRWIKYFHQMPDFMGNDGACLAGHSVLIGNDGDLHKTMSPSTENDRDLSKKHGRKALQTAIFSPPDPRRSDAEDNLEINPPKKLSKQFGFLWNGLPWHAELADSRVYLEEYRLVGEFDREVVLAHLSRVLRSVRNKNILNSGLRWAFQLWLQPRAGNRPFRLQSQHKFQVPTLDGRFIDASEAVFSSDWPKNTLGAVLDDFLDSAPRDIPDLKALAAQRLAAPDHKTFQNKLLDDWVEFLSELGVGRGLKSVIKSSKTRFFAASEIPNFYFVESYNISMEFAQFWRNDIEMMDQALLTLGYTTDYEIVGELQWLPGQDCLNSFSPKCRILYAQLIFDWLAYPSSLICEFEIRHRNFRNADRKTWPTPLLSFLRSAQWIPIEDPARVDTEQHFAAPSELWFNSNDGEIFLPFLPRPTREIRSFLERADDEFIQLLRAQLKLNILDDSEGLADQLAFLADHFNGERFDEHFKPRLLNLYFRTWRKFLTEVENSIYEPEKMEVPVMILARRYHTTEVVNMFLEEEEKGEIVYICDTDRESDVSLLTASGQLYFQIKDSDPKRTGELFEKFYETRIRRMSQVSVEFLAGGRAIGDVDKVPALEICPHLRSMVAIAAEALTGTEAQRLPADRSEMLAKLERISLSKASTLNFAIEGISILPEQISSQAFRFALENEQSVIIVGSSEEWNWELIDRCLPAICEALAQRALVPNLRLLWAHVGREEYNSDTSKLSNFVVDRMAEVLHLPPSSVASALSTLSAGFQRQVPWIQAVLHHVIGPAAAEEFSNMSDKTSGDPSLFRDLLQKQLEGYPIKADILLEVARSALGPEDFREALELDFAGFNSSLLELGHTPITYPDIHKWALNNFIRERELEITNCLLASYAEVLNKMHPANGYSAKRESFRNLEPDPDWLYLFKEPPETILQEFVNAWLEGQKAPTLNELDENFAQITQIRDHNRNFLPNFSKRVIPLIRAWCSKYQAEESHALAVDEIEYEELRKRLDDVGVVDFFKLDEISAAEWLQVLQIWPAEMPLSLELSTLGLSVDDLNDESIKALEAKKARAREARLVSFNGKLLDPINVDLVEISNQIEVTLSTSLLGKALGSPTNLAEAKQNVHSSSRSKWKKDHKKGGRKRVPEEKTELIGRLGELIVYHWLRKILPKQDIDAAWQSENGALITGRNGNDGLGYDFEVTYRNQIWQIEVKASIEDPLTFEMGETEVRAARDAARSRSGVQYKIAYVSNVAEPTKAMIEMLPNPMTEEGARVLELRGEGIRYGFNRV